MIQDDRVLYRSEIKCKEEYRIRINNGNNTYCIILGIRNHIMYAIIFTDIDVVYILVFCVIMFYPALCPEQDIS